ncbi:hypothetical protein ACFE04_023286 [Oxalis oulophora]
MALSALDLPTVCSLTNSMSQDESVRKPSEATLFQLESMPDFCSCLMADVWYGLSNSLEPKVDCSLLNCNGTLLNSNVYGQTVTTDHHQDLLNIGINPVLQGTTFSYPFPYVICCPPPSKSSDFPADLR